METTHFYYYAYLDSQNKPSMSIYPCTVTEVGKSRFAVDDRGNATRLYSSLRCQGVADTEAEARAAVAQFYRDIAAELLSKAREVENHESANAT